MSERYVTESSRLEKSSLGITEVYDVLPLLVMGKIFSIIARFWIFFRVSPSRTRLLCQSLVLRPVATVGSHQSPCPTAP